METPEFFDADAPDSPSAGRARRRRRSAPPRSTTAERALWVSGLVLAVSSFTDWYAGSTGGVKIAVIGWHTGTLGKLVFFIGLAAIALVVLREAGLELPPSLPESALITGLGILSTTFVVVRLASVPESMLPASGRGIGIWISLLASLGVIGAGVLQAAEEL